VHLRIHCILYDQEPDSNVAPFVYATDLSANGTYLKKSNLECTASQGAGILMGRNSTFLLDDGDELSISDTVTLIYHPTTPVQLIKLTTAQERERQTFASRFLVTGRLLGEGGYGKVLVGIDQDTQRQLACKIIRIDKLHNKTAVQNLQLPIVGRQEHERQTRKRWPTRVANCFREFDILKDLTHPNIITLEKVFWSPNTIYIFLEIATGGDLFSFLNFKGGKLDSMQAATVVHQILQGVKYLHDQGIAHRDLKPDNVLMTSFEEDARVVISDFGAARSLPGENSSNSEQSNKYQRMFSVVGTFEYAAPEIYRLNCTIPADGGYSKSVDMWSIGSITAVLLTGEALFVNRSHPEYLTNPKDVIIGLAAVCDLRVLDEDHHPHWGVVGNLPKHFIKNLLVLKEKDRMNVSMALAHPWFSEDTKEVYARITAGWKPGKKNVRLIERITSPLLDLAPDVSGTTSSHVTSSNHFGEAASQIRRSNTPLPSITQDRGLGQFASRVKPLLTRNKDAAPHLQLGSQLGYCDTRKPHTGGAFIQQHYESLSCIAGSSQESHSPHGRAKFRRSGHQELLAKVNQSSIYINNVDDDKDSDCSGENLNRVTDNYSQRRDLIRRLQHSDYQEEHGSVQVYETPPNKPMNYEGCSDEQRIVRKLYYQQQEALESDGDSVLVQETPPELMRKRERVSNEALPAHEWRFGNDKTGTCLDGYAHGKRPKHSRYDL